MMIQIVAPTPIMPNKTLAHTFPFRFMAGTLKLLWILSEPRGDGGQRMTPPASRQSPLNMYYGISGSDSQKNLVGSANSQPLG